MTERPILFSAPMVRALLAGTKTQTRRVAKHPLLQTLSCILHCGGGWWGDDEGEVQVRCPYGEPGDRLWVRETFQSFTDDGQIIYRADPASFDAMNELKLDGCIEARWRPAIQMPRWASRILLEVTAVRVERLQDISEADAIAEGTYSYAARLAENPAVTAANIKALIGKYGEGKVRCLYAALWESINGDGSWNTNPWVWVIEFKRVTS